MLGLQLRVWMAILLLLSVSPMAQLQAAGRDWFTLSIDDQRVGFAYREAQADKDNHTYTQYFRIDVTQFRKSTSIERRIVVQRDGKGALKRIDVSSAVGSRRDGWKASFTNSSDTMTRRETLSDHDDRIPLPRTTHAPDEQLNFLSPLWRSATTELSYINIEPSRALPTEMRANIIQDPAAAKTNLVHIRTAMAATPTIASEDLWIDKNGHLERIEQPFFGRVLQWTHCEVECDKAVATPFDPMTRLVVRSPFRIPLRAFGGPIRYVVTTSAGTPPALPSTSEQTIASNGKSAVITVCGDCGSEHANERDVSQYLKPNDWVQSDNREIKAFARRSAVGNSSPANRMNHLVAAVRAHMTGAVDYLGYYSAVDAFHSRSGDCTEFAVLLAAMARAEGIAARVVFGLVYADRFSGKKDVFSPHAWVQAWDGKKWVSYDAALEGFDATHIALAVGDGRPQQYEAAFRLLTDWRIEKLGLLPHNAAEPSTKEAR